MIVPGSVLKAIFPVADIVEKPDSGDVIHKGESQLLYGESFVQEKDHGNWVYGVSGVDGYHGFVRKDCLEQSKNKSTHFVSSLSTLVYPRPDFKTRPNLNLSFLSRLSVSEGSAREGFLWAEGAGWVPEMHVQPLSALKKPVDHVETAMMFINSPYRYGGRLAWGIDCSGLVQLALIRNGINCPRDSGQQMNSAGKEASRDEIARGDIVFFPGHVGIMVDSENILNASARTMSVRIEALKELEKIYREITCIRRI
jgi:cell wall-associated NlpC family hydrolase